VVALADLFQDQLDKAPRYLQQNPQPKGYSMLISQLSWTKRLPAIAARRVDAIVSPRRRTITRSIWRGVAAGKQCISESRWPWDVRGTEK